MAGCGPSLDRLNPTHTCLWRFSGRLAGVLCKPPFAEFVKKNRIRCKQSLQDFYQRREQQCTGRISKRDGARTTQADGEGAPKRSLKPMEAALQIAATGRHRLRYEHTCFAARNGWAVVPARFTMRHDFFAANFCRSNRQCVSLQATRFRLDTANGALLDAGWKPETPQRRERLTCLDTGRKLWELPDPSTSALVFTEPREAIPPAEFTRGLQALPALCGIA